MRTIPCLGAVMMALGLGFGFGGLSGSPRVRGDVWQIAEAVEKGKIAEADALFKALGPADRDMALELLRPEPRQAKLAPAAANVAKARFLLRHSTLARDIAHAARALPPGEVTDKALAAAAPEAKPALLLLRTLNADPSVSPEKWGAKRAFEEWLAGAPTEADLIFLRTDPAMRALADLQKPLLPLLIQRGLATEDEIMLAFRSIPTDRPSQAAAFWAEHCHRLSNPPFYPHRYDLAKAQLESKRHDLVEKLVEHCPPMPGRPDRVDWNLIRIKLRLAQGDEARMEEAVLEGLREAQAQADLKQWHFSYYPFLLAESAHAAGKGEWLDALLAKGGHAESAGVFWRATRLALDLRREAPERVGELLQGINLKDVSPALRDSLVNEGNLLLERAGRYTEALQFLENSGPETYYLRGRILLRMERYDAFEAFLRDPATSPLDGAKALLDSMEILQEREEWDRLLKWTENPKRFIDLGPQLHLTYKIPTARILALKKKGRVDEAIAFYFQELLTHAPPTEELKHSADLLLDAPGFTPALKVFLDGMAPDKISKATVVAMRSVMRAKFTAEQQRLVLQGFARLDVPGKASEDLSNAYMSNLPYPFLLEQLETLVPQSPAQHEKWMNHALFLAQRGNVSENLETLQAFFDFLLRDPRRLSLGLANNIALLRRRTEQKAIIAGFFADVLRKGVEDPVVRVAAYEYMAGISGPKDHPDVVRLFATRDLELLLKAGPIPAASAMGNLIGRAKQLQLDGDILALVRAYQGKATDEKTIRTIETILAGDTKGKN